jgi:hypothetical protein
MSPYHKNLNIFFNEYPKFIKKITLEFLKLNIIFIIQAVSSKKRPNRSSVIYCSILINKRGNTMVQKTLQSGLNFLFFSTLIVMSNKRTLFF